MEERQSEQIKNVKIFVRILPCLEIYESLVKIDDNKKDMYVRCLQDVKRDKISKSKNPIYWQFPTDRVFHNSSQEEVYEVVTKDLIDNILDGANCVLISYGQTGSGKSFTTSGLRNNYEHRGIIARLLSDMFEEKQKRKYSNRIEYCLSYVEMYQNQVNDLLISREEQRKCNIRDALKHVTSVSVDSEDETLKKIFEGEARKIIDQGETYDASHQGTSILSFHVSNISLITSWAVAAHSKIHIVDMAGVDSIGNTSSRKPAATIGNANLDKTQMEQFILDLQNSKKPKIHSYSSNLLKYLGPAFSLDSLLRFIAHVRVSSADLALTLSVLRFSSNVKKLKPKKIRYDVTPESTLEIRKLRKDIDALKQELDINHMLYHQEPLSNISTSRAKQIERDASDFINGSLDDLMLLSVSQAQILLKTFKDMFAKLRADHKIALEQAARDAYDLAAKDLKGSTSSVANNKTLKNAVTGNNGRIRRKKSVVERLSKVTSQPSLVEDETAKDKVGELVETGLEITPVLYKRENFTPKRLNLPSEDIGITIGPCQLEPAISPVVRLMKMKKYGEQSNRVTVPCSDSTEPVKKTTKRDDVFECYLREEEEAMMLKEEVDEIKAQRKIAQVVLTDVILKQKKIKTEMESKRAELGKQQNIRHLMGNEVYDNEGRILIPELERRLFNDVIGLETELSNLQCQVMQANEDLRQLLDNEQKSNYKLECGFQIFCEKMYDQVRPQFDEDDSREEDNTVESLDVTEQMRHKFVDLQKMMKLMIENKPVPRKEWRNHIGNRGK